MSATLTENKTATHIDFFVNGQTPVNVEFGAFFKLRDDAEFFEFCQLNKHLRIEMNDEGDLIIMPPTGGKTGNRNFNLIVELGIWAKNDGTGYGFDSSTVFRLPNGAKRSPDLAWVRRERWDALSETEQETFPPLCPDFVVELRSRTDSLDALQEKMREYAACGAQLGWLIDPTERKVYVYRPNATTEILDDPPTISGEPLLKDFRLDLQTIWE